MPVLIYIGVTVFLAGVTVFILGVTRWVSISKMARRYNPIYEQPWQAISEKWRWCTVTFAGLNTMWVGVFLMHVAAGRF